MLVGQLSVDQVGDTVDRRRVVVQSFDFEFGQFAIREFDSQEVADSKALLGRCLIQQGDPVGAQVERTFSQTHVENGGSGRRIPGPGVDAPVIHPDLKEAVTTDDVNLVQGIKLVNQRARERKRLTGRSHNKVCAEGVLQHLVEVVDDGGGQHGHTGDEGQADHQRGSGGRRALRVAAGVVPSQSAGCTFQRLDRAAQDGGDHTGEQGTQHGHADEDHGGTDTEGHEDVGRRLDLARQAEEQQDHADGQYQRSAQDPEGGRPLVDASAPYSFKRGNPSSPEGRDERRDHGDQ